MENNKSPDMLLIEKSFQLIKQKENLIEATDTIRRVLKRTFDLNVDISIVNNKTNKFFGMNIYPTVTTMDKLLTAIITDKSASDRIMDIWRENKDWYLEIDSILLYDRVLNANPAELTAVLLHEIGHIVYSNTVPERVNKVIRAELLNINYSLRELCKHSMVSKIFELSIIEACSNKSFSYVNTSGEREADKFVVQQGYGHELDNFITKLLSTQGNASINKTDEDLDTDVKVIVKWAIDNVTEIQLRKTKLKQSLDVQTMKSPSLFVKNVLQNLKKAFVKNEGNAYKEAISEQVLFSQHARIVKESIIPFMDSFGKLKKVNQLDIDVINVQIEKMQNQDDKIYLLDLVYDKLELVNLSLDTIDQGYADRVRQSKSTLTGMKTQLEKMRSQILSTKVQDKQYGVFIKYPVGYEG